MSSLLAAATSAQPAVSNHIHSNSKPTPDRTALALQILSHARTCTLPHNTPTASNLRAWGVGAHSLSVRYKHDSWDLDEVFGRGEMLVYLKPEICACGNCAAMSVLSVSDVSRRPRSASLFTIAYHFFLSPFTTNNTTTLVHGHLPRLHCRSPWRQCTNGALQSGHHPRYVCVVPPSKLRRHQTDQSMCVDCKQQQPGADGALVATDSYAPWDGAGVSEATGV